MVNESEELTGAPLTDEVGAGQFATSEGGEEEESYEKLLERYGGIRKFAEGEVLLGTVLKITDTVVVVDIGYKSEGLIPVDQFQDQFGPGRCRGGRHDRRVHRKHGGLRRTYRPLQGKGRESKSLGRCREGTTTKARSLPERSSNGSRVGSPSISAFGHSFPDPRWTFGQSRIWTPSVGRKSSVSSSS